MNEINMAHKRPQSEATSAPTPSITSTGCAERIPERGWGRPDPPEAQKESSAEAAGLLGLQAGAGIARQRIIGLHRSLAGGRGP